MSDKLIYLASPYSHKEDKVRFERFETIARVAAKLMSQGVYLFCPITHTHPINEAGINNPGWDFWCKYDYMMLDRCQELWIADMPGWKESVGVTAEIKYMMEANKPVFIFSAYNILNGFPLELVEQYNPFISQRI